MISRLGRRCAAIILVALSSTATARAATTTPADDPWLVVAVTDGDTLDVAQGATVLTVRLIGINAPESDECWSAEATDALTDIVGPGPVWLVTDHSDVDPYGRALRYLIDGDGDDVGVQLVEQGAAIARGYPPDTANDARYALLQVAAQRDGRGLWAPAACGAVVAAAGLAPSISIDIHEDAAGNDNENPNDEWVRFANTGGSPFDLDGWTVRDESSSHRYRFADLVLEPGGAVTLLTGCGTDTTTDRYWCNSGSAVWNNDGDTAFLLDPDGNVLVSESY